MRITSLVLFRENSCGTSFSGKKEKVYLFICKRLLAHLRDDDLGVLLPQPVLLHVVSPPRTVQQEPVFVGQLAQHVPHLALHRRVAVSHAQGGGNRQNHSNVRRLSLVQLPRQSCEPAWFPGYLPGFWMG